MECIYSWLFENSLEDFSIWDYVFYLCWDVWGPIYRKTSRYGVCLMARKSPQRLETASKIGTLKYFGVPFYQAQCATHKQNDMSFWNGMPNAYSRNGMPKFIGVPFSTSFLNFFFFWPICYWVQKPIQYTAENWYADFTLKPISDLFFLLFSPVICVPIFSIFGRSLQFPRIQDITFAWIMETWSSIFNLQQIWLVYI